MTEEEAVPEEEQQKKEEHQLDSLAWALKFLQDYERKHKK